MQLLSFLEKVGILINISRNLLCEDRLHFTFRPWTGSTHQTLLVREGEFDYKAFVQNQYISTICMQQNAQEGSLQQNPQEGSPVPPTCTEAVTAT